MTAVLGVNCSPAGSDKASDLLAAGVRYVTYPMWPECDVRMITMGYQARGIDVFLRCDSKTLSVSNDPRRQAEHWRGVVGDLVKVLSWGANEFDQIGSTSSTASEEEVYEQLKAARKVFSLHTLVGPNCASSQPERWTKRLDGLVDVIALSRYPAKVEQMSDGLYGPFGYLRHTPHKPVFFGEFPIWSEAYVSEALRLSQRAYVYNWRSWWQSQEAHWPDGLIGLDGKPTWRMDVFRKFALESDMAVDPGVEARLKALESKLADAETRIGLHTDLTARVLRGAWHDGAESAEALLRTIAPDKYKTFEAVPFR